MPWEIDSERPVYLQLIERIKRDILSGKYPPGERLPSVRDLAAEASVNPNTMQKALSELERDGLVFSQRTSGRFITDDTARIEEIREGLAKEEAAAFMERMKTLGYDTEQVIELIRRNLK